VLSLVSLLVLSNKNKDLLEVVHFVSREDDEDQEMQQGTIKMLKPPKVHTMHVIHCQAHVGKSCHLVEITFGGPVRSVGVWHQQTLLPLAVLSVVKPRPCSAKTAGTQRTRSVMVGDPRVASSEVAKKIVFRNIFLK